MFKSVDLKSKPLQKAELQKKERLKFTKLLQTVLLPSIKKRFHRWNFIKKDSIVHWSPTDRMKDGKAEEPKVPNL
jgi:hypothetical protein